MESKPTIKTRRSMGWDIVYARKSVIAFFVSTLAILLFYRIQLTWALLTSPVRPFDCSSYKSQRNVLLRFPCLHNANLIRYNV
jgi:hypothetical protein